MIRTTIVIHTARIATVVAMGFLSVTAAAETAPADIPGRIGAQLSQPELIVEGVTLDSDYLRAAYQVRDFQPVWATHPEMVIVLADELDAAGKEGIDARALKPDALRSALADPTLSVEDRELLLSDRYLALAHILTQGSVPPAAIEDDWLLPRSEFDPASSLAALAGSGNPAASLAALRPSSPQYQMLRAALDHYRALSTSGWADVPDTGKIEPKAQGPQVLALRARLIAEGELVDGAAAAPDVYDPDMVAAMKRFQARHGLAADGRAGKTTFAALNVSAADRARQIELALERLREMPHSWPATRVQVNIPAATLTLYRDDVPVLTSRGIVGDRKHQTPVLSAAANAVLFNPPWNVPSSSSGPRCGAKFGTTRITWPTIISSGRIQADCSRSLGRGIRLAGSRSSCPTRWTYICMTRRRARCSPCRLGR